MNITKALVAESQAEFMAIERLLSNPSPTAVEQARVRAWRMASRIEEKLHQHPAH